MRIKKIFYIYIIYIYKMEGYTRPLNTFQKVQIEKEKKLKEQREALQKKIAEDLRIAKEEEALRKQEEAEAIKKDADRRQKLIDDRDDYVNKVKAEVTFEKMEEELKVMVGKLAHYDRRYIKLVVDQHFKKEMEEVVDRFRIVFEDVPNDDPIKQGVTLLIEDGLQTKVSEVPKFKYDFE